MCNAHQRWITEVEEMAPPFWLVSSLALRPVLLIGATDKAAKSKAKNSRYAVLASDLHHIAPSSFPCQGPSSMNIFPCFFRDFFYLFEISCSAFAPQLLLVPTYCVIFVFVFLLPTWRLNRRAILPSWSRASTPTTVASPRCAASRDKSPRVS